MSSTPTPGVRSSRWARARAPIIVGTAVALIGSLGVAILLRSGEPGPTTRASAAPPRATSAPAPAPAPAPTGPVPAEAPPVPALTTADAGARAVEEGLAGTATTTSVRYAFDAGPSRTVLDTQGRYALRAVAARGGLVGFARRGDGYAIRFPARCRSAPAECPRAILESTRGDVFNAGTRALRFGATLLITRADTAAGSNVLQKGFSVGDGSQFKLQVDGRAGRPSCVLASGGTIHRLVGPVGVADGRWHSVTCTRVGARMSINVDGRAVSRGVPAGLSIRNNEPLRIGGKNVGPYNDQFAGQLDDVFVAVY
jgi:hypothetical protein